MNELDASESESALPDDALVLACAGVPILIFYALAQTVLAVLIGPGCPQLKLVMEPNLLLIGLALHIQWRRVRELCQIHGIQTPLWILLADCLSFVITFWALAVLGQVILFG